MPSNEVLHQFGQSEPDATGIGPVQDTTDRTPQGLLEMHRKLAAKPNSSDRVRSTGARSPASLAAEIEAQIKRVADKKMGDKEQFN
ncbi:hypothetical protein B0J13DRAFT_623741 [Dactylonectria estremocensis]|uniref:Uncharacterized protein n=1 Tax=Dactylonectria estremocensis TaxID=1079267 RepID=A0A9P9J104_9HYPO|nr:hypothetical protein B0J13DRAFT_623741 [Dactylonectria estremocensis]